MALPLNIGSIRHQVDDTAGINICEQTKQSEAYNEKYRVSSDSSRLVSLALALNLAVDLLRRL